MGKLRESLSFSIGHKVKQFKAVVDSTNQIKKCPFCYSEMELIEQCSGHGHQTGKAPDLSSRKAQAKQALTELIEIQKCPDCKERLMGINFHAKMGHPRVE